MPRFNEKILLVISQIPVGKVATYGQIAALAGAPRASRLVGGTLKKLPEESKVPWHRVINSQGRISLPLESPSHEVQKNRLEEEGVTFIRGKVDLKLYGWKP